ncbi:hypothetical protein EV673_1112 [Limnobacter thiooxidans]|mgnify:FL=1|uniref:Uncharacterized protein n=1 Tax=Limnobacter thiooxidans TaxID=131080 RepID=A0AA86MDB6_9BURK|nr:hypothetical protein [Limnobacter sp.]MCZ8015684.1 hypothetical protein [Limnobacter sp.]RZS42768.1 hypothetical protein EV673_1112 [Limnobacter thiooxidans]BET25796.1 hypothetical protein RGQ30_12970 [Limnobacter thiooxidans]
MDDFTNKVTDMHTLGELESRREWMVGVLGGSFCYGLILWLC